jgi:hypothetical protein
LRVLEDLRCFSQTPFPHDAYPPYAFTSFAGEFGVSGDFFTPPSSIFGDDFVIWGGVGFTELVGVPVGYISGRAINSGMVFNGATIAGFTMIPGTYNYNLPSDTVTLHIIPEPSVVLLIGLGLAGLAARKGL